MSLSSDVRRLELASALVGLENEGHAADALRRTDPVSVMVAVVSERLESHEALLQRWTSACAAGR